VLKEKEENNNQYIIGSKTFLLPKYTNNVLLNDVTNVDSINIRIYDPLTDHNLRKWDANLDTIEDFTERATIFIYVKNNDIDDIDDIDKIHILAVDIKLYLDIHTGGEDLEGGGREIIDKINKFEELLNGF
jgi:hypothetical protein